MSIEQFEKDLANVTTAIEQSLTNHNVLIGQKQALIHVIAKLKEAAQAVEKIATVADQVVEVVSPDATASVANAAE